MKSYKTYVFSLSTYYFFYLSVAEIQMSKVFCRQYVNIQFVLKGPCLGSRCNGNLLITIHGKLRV